jgi:hypothetical protein
VIAADADGKPKPKLLSFSFSVVDGDVKPDPGPEPGPDPNPIPNPEPQTLEDFVRANSPKNLKESQNTLLISAFETTGKNLAENRIRTADAAVNSIRISTSPYFRNQPEVRSILAEVIK